MLVVDPNVTQFIPIGQANTVILTGLAPRVGTTVEIMKRLDEGVRLTTEHRQEQAKAAAALLDKGAKSSAGD